jgi:hypothetical protein
MRALAVALASAMLVRATLASAADKDAKAPDTAASNAADPNRVELARRHFDNGVKLYRDGNYTGSLAEFEAAYQLKQGAGSLQNIALSLKALFRYAEAADTLRLLLTRHGAELSEEEKQTVRRTVEELDSLVGTVVIHVTPSHARVTVDGRPLDAKERSDGVRLNVGEHTIAAEAPGYARGVQIVRIAGGRDRIPLQLILRQVAGFITVEANDPGAAIAVDGKEKSFQRWSGPVEPGRHYVQVYKEGHETFERIVRVKAGQNETINAELGPPLEPDEVKPAPGQAAARQIRGWYGLVTFDVTGVSDVPKGIDIEQATPEGGGSIGVRAGYRVWTPIGVEGLLLGGRQEVKNACDTGAAEPGESECGGEENGLLVNYQLESLRFGGNLRLMSGGERVRFTSALGVGAVRHKVEIEPKSGARPRSAEGIDVYFLIELGIQMNFGHFLAEADFIGFIDTAGNTVGAQDEAVFGDDKVLFVGGLGLRGGWSEWKP